MKWIHFQGFTIVPAWAVNFTSFTSFQEERGREGLEHTVVQSNVSEAAKGNMAMYGDTPL